MTALKRVISNVRVRHYSTTHGCGTEIRYDLNGVASCARSGSGVMAEAEAKRWLLQKPCFDDRGQIVHGVQSVAW